jgi:predicted alpha/beta-hydrolase family hydrolase
LLLLAFYSAGQNGDPARKGQARIGASRAPVHNKDSMTLPRSIRIFAALIVSTVAVSTTAGAAERVETIPTRPGITQGLFIVDAKGKPWAAAILYVGGDGKMALDGSGPTDLKGNFLLRIADRLSTAGIALVYPDTPSDQRNGFGNSRTGPDHMKDGQAVVAWTRQHIDAPIFVIGTSRGTISAVNIAADIEPGAIAGVVLTSSLMLPSRTTNAIDDAQLARVAVPTLVVHHRDDGCGVTKPAEVPQLMDGLKSTPRKDLIWISGGLPAKSGPCDGKSAHGYFGAEAEATKAMIDWMKATVGGR